MKRISTILCCVILSISINAHAQDSQPDPPKPPQTIQEQGSYGIGLQIGRTLQRTLKAQNLNVSPTMIARGLVDGLMGKKSAVSEAQLEQAMESFQQQAASGQRSAGAENQKIGEEFLAANQKKPGVTTLPSGLQYRVLKSGNGPSPKATDRVRTHYHGTLIDGTVFDSSVERKEPATFPVNRVIPGWTEALQLMKVGDKWQLFIPSELAYGERGAGELIGPKSTLIFEVELLEIL